MKKAEAGRRDEQLQIGEGHGLPLARRRRPAGNIGAAVLQPDTPNRITGVRIEPGAIYPDDL